MDFLQATLLAVALILILVWLTTGTPRGMPPGPAGLPLLGYPLTGRPLHVTAMELAKRYGNVYTLPLVRGYAVVLNDWKSIKEALVLQSEAFSGRPRSVMADVVMLRTDIVFSDGIAWKERRRFTLQHLKDFGFGQRSMEGVITEEVSKLLDHLASLDGQKVDFGNPLYFSFLNIIWTIVSGKHFEPNDPYMRHVVMAVDKIVEGLTSNHLMNLLTPLRHLPGSGYWPFYEAYKKLDDFLIKEVEEHVKTYQEGHARDFIDVYLAEIEKRQQERNSSSTRSFQKKHLCAVIMDLFVGGIETGCTTQLWALLYMATWPEIQTRVQEEMDRVIGRARLPTTQDRALLPYTEAVLLEILRHATFLPMSVPHNTMAKTELFGYTIPKSTTIYENIWGVHHDPAIWGDPDVFRPERFLTADGKVNKPEYLIPFSVGGRSCLGEPLAKMEMFLFFTCLLHRFSFSVVTGEKPPSLEPVVHLTLKPEPYFLMVKQR